MVVNTLSTTYFGPVQWYQKLFRADVCRVEKYDHFVKQTYRNRCLIATSAGVQALVVPIESTGEKQLMRDVRISDHGKWQQEHWNALLSAYGESPFYDFLADDLRPFFFRKWRFLWDFNMEIALKMCEWLQIEPRIVATEAYEKEVEGDFRDAIRPKHPLADAQFAPRAYYQVFAREHGFLPNLSILDLLFNMGNEAVLYL